MKYKVGDRVRVREDLEVNSAYGGICFVDNMPLLKGTVVTVRKVLSDTYKIAGSDYAWTDEMLEDADPECYVRVNTCNGGETFQVDDKNGIDDIIEKVRRTLEDALKPKGKFMPKIGEKYWYVNTFGCMLRTTYGGADDEYLLNNSPVFRTKEEADDYMLFREQVAGLNKPFVYGNENFIFYYDYDDKELAPTSWQTLYFGTPIFGYTIEEIEKAREILGDDRIKKYLMDVWE